MRGFSGTGDYEAGKEKKNFKTLDYTTALKYCDAYAMGLFNFTFLLYYHPLTLGCIFSLVAQYKSHCQWLK